eukprot:g144.t1
MRVYVSLLLLLLIGFIVIRNGNAVNDFYGLALVTNSPAMYGLIRIDGDTGDAVSVGPAHAQLFGCGDLIAIAHGIFYYLGDTLNGTTLVGINMTDGSQHCSRSIPLREIGFVGLGQTLDYDDKTDTLLLSGVNQNVTTPSHSVFRSSATECGPFELNGTYGDADFVPMLHSSTLDASRQRLFVLLADGKTSQAIGIVDLVNGSMDTVAEGTPNLDDTLIGIHWDENRSSLVGIIVDDQEGFMLHSLHVSKTSSWNPPTKIEGIPSEWNAIYGNEATVSAFSEITRAIYFLAGVQDNGRIVSQYLVGVGVDSSALISVLELPKIGLGDSGLIALALA